MGMVKAQPRPKKYKKLPARMIIWLEKPEKLRFFFLALGASLTTPPHPTPPCCLVGALILTFSFMEGVVHAKWCKLHICDIHKCVQALSLKIHLCKERYM